MIEKNSKPLDLTLQELILAYLRNKMDEFESPQQQKLRREILSKIK